MQIDYEIVHTKPNIPEVNCIKNKDLLNHLSLEGDLYI